MGCTLVGSVQGRPLTSYLLPHGGQESSANQTTLADLAQAAYAWSQHPTGAQERGCLSLANGASATSSKSYRQLFADSLELANILGQTGAPLHGRVLLAAANTDELIHAYLAVLLANMVPITVALPPEQWLGHSNAPQTSEQTRLAISQEQTLFMDIMETAQADVLIVPVAYRELANSHIAAWDSSPAALVRLKPVPVISMRYQPDIAADLRRINLDDQINHLNSPPATNPPATNPPTTTPPSTQPLARREQPEGRESEVVVHDIPVLDTPVPMGEQETTQHGLSSGPAAREPQYPAFVHIERNGNLIQQNSYSNNFANHMLQSLLDRVNSWSRRHALPQDGHRVIPLLSPTNPAWPLLTVLFPVLLKSSVIREAADGKNLSRLLASDANPPDSYILLYDDLNMSQLTDQQQNRAAIKQLTETDPTLQLFWHDALNTIDQQEWLPKHRSGELASILTLPAVAGGIPIGLGDINSTDGTVVYRPLPGLKFGLAALEKDYRGEVELDIANPFVGADAHGLSLLVTGIVHANTTPLHLFPDIYRDSNKTLWQETGFDANRIDGALQIGMAADKPPSPDLQVSNHFFTDKTDLLQKKADPSDPECYFAHINSAYMAGNYPATRILLENIEQPHTLTPEYQRLYHFAMAISYYREEFKRRGPFLQAQPAMETFLALAKTHQAQGDIALAYNYLGEMAFAVGEYQQAILCFNQAFPSHSPQDVARYLNIIPMSAVGILSKSAKSHYYLGAKERATKLFLQAVRLGWHRLLARPATTPENRLRPYIHEAVVAYIIYMNYLAKQGLLCYWIGQAALMLQRKLEASSTAPTSDLLSQLLRRLGYMTILGNCPVIAKQYYLKANELVVSNTEGCDLYRNLGGIYRVLGHRDEALRYLTKAASLAHVLPPGQPDKQVAIAVEISQCHAQFEQYEQALEVLATTDYKSVFPRLRADHAYYHRAYAQQLAKMSPEGCPMDWASVQPEPPLFKGNIAVAIEETPLAQKSAQNHPIGSERVTPTFEFSANTQNQKEVWQTIRAAQGITGQDVPNEPDDHSPTSDAPTAPTPLPVINPPVGANVSSKVSLIDTRFAQVKYLLNQSRELFLEHENTVLPKIQQLNLTAQNQKLKELITQRKSIAVLPAYMHYVNDPFFSSKPLPEEATLKGYRDRLSDKGAGELSEQNTH